MVGRPRKGSNEPRFNNAQYMKGYRRKKKEQALCLFNSSEFSAMTEFRGGNRVLVLSPENNLVHFTLLRILSVYSKGKLRRDLDTWIRQIQEVELNARTETTSGRPKESKGE